MLMTFGKWCDFSYFSISCQKCTRCAFSCIGISRTVLYSHILFHSCIKDRDKTLSSMQSHTLMRCSKKYEINIEESCSKIDYFEWYLNLVILFHFSLYLVSSNLGWKKLFHWNENEIKAVVIPITNLQKATTKEYWGAYLNIFNIWLMVESMGF